MDRAQDSTSMRTLMEQHASVIQLGISTIKLAEKTQRLIHLEVQVPMTTTTNLVTTLMPKFSASDAKRRYRLAQVLVIINMNVQRGL